MKEFQTQIIHYINLLLQLFEFGNSNKLSTQLNPKFSYKNLIYCFLQIYKENNNLWITQKIFCLQIYNQLNPSIKNCIGIDDIKIHYIYLALLDKQDQLILTIYIKVILNVKGRSF
ncbi:unnamed protein product (macronuclear) [Paramecium tetraurelia]|uniref:Transmembrane protein n=1 Tax=Paramecium tetraurelia TaxID=5888 RepID=A0DWP6_PARTE|nr:uncharacterized protein GSPATT00021106001 [Paramecium tetraurelia]CAK87463.1 unnamed protein product [Paramecium tetraurelia]|eukprot:XP_001454860.1 hypothetical protein (macronuclear) [Paramecium tetraurelia strain d4-2]